jgi:hypothetical protein
MQLVDIRGKILRLAANRSIALWLPHLQITRWCALLSILAGQECIGQVSSTSGIITDRPDITESSVVIPVGSVQVENGLTWSADHSTVTVDLSETLIRVGILERTEVRFTPPNYVGELGRSRVVSRFDDPSVGLKEQIGPLVGAFDLSVIVGSGIRLDASKPPSRHVSPFVRFPLSHDWPNGWSVGACNHSSTAPTMYPMR